MSSPVSVQILDREYLVACAPEERGGLNQAAALLDSKMRDLRQAARGASLDRIAVLAALNLAHELVQLREDQSGSRAAMDQHLQLLRSKLDAALGKV
jgi:cell division protein ZapA